MDQASGDPNIRHLSRNAWVCCGDELYILECMGKGFIRVEPVEGGEEGMLMSLKLYDRPALLIPYLGEKYQAHYTPPTLTRGTAYMLKISPYRRSKKILSAQTLAEAIRDCDTYAQSKVLPGQVALG